MRYSMKRQFVFIFTLLITGMILLCLLANSTLLEKYYINDKKNALIKAYTSINAASNAGDITSELYDIELQKIRDKYNINILILDSDSKTVKTTMLDQEFAIKHLLNNIFYGVNQEEVLLEADSYMIQIVTDVRTQTEYIEMWGMLDNGYFFILRSALESIQESAAISNRFMAYVGGIAIVVSILMVVGLSNRITKPIMELAGISERMKHLDFDAKYTGNDRTEIAVLGNNINEMSEVLETTISELKTANNELLKDIERKDQIDEKRREFLSNVSHELKTPIALIQGYAEGLREGINDDVESREFYCDVIIDEAAKMNTMVRQLLTLNQLESSNEVVRMEDYEAVYVWGDEFKVEEVFMNYFTNAIHYAQDERIIDVKLRHMDGQVKVSVFNTGTPIPAESLEHIWEKFYKVDKARTREYGGSGIGLSIVKAIMESMNQQYGVTNYENGVEFWFTLDVA